MENIKEFSKIDWKAQGGKIDIPDGWSVIFTDFDVDPPYILMVPDSIKRNDYMNFINKSMVVLIPKSLAYFLSTHFCGSRVMQNVLIEQGKHEVQNKIKEALDIMEGKKDEK